MPTYLYQCPTCGEYEVSHAMSEPPRETCPSCGLPVTRLIAGGNGVIVKGPHGTDNHCNRGTPCCGRETRCDRPPCGK
jgi:putative FmdB family regulatory protein